VALIKGVEMINTQKCQNAQELARKLIPGKTQLLSKRPEMFAPGVWPGYYKKAKGQKIWDLDNNKYFDFSIAGIGANVLGYADDFVDESVEKAIRLGSSSSLNCYEELDLAKLMTELHPWSSMARYARSGGEAVTIALRIARAHTKRDKIVFCGYHGWHDWYLSSNISNGDNLSEHLLSGLSPQGVPKALEGNSIPFKYNDINGLETILENNRNSIAAIIMEPFGNSFTSEEFLHKVKKLANKNGIILIFDEISSGFRINTGGIHLTYGVDPDIAIFSKAISNGYPMSVVIGREDVMQSAQETFISSTSWTERIGPTASIATIKKFRTKRVSKHLVEIGNIVNNGWQFAADRANLKIEISGLSCLSKFKFKHELDSEMRTYFTQEMLERGFLAAGRFYAMYAHTEKATHNYVDETIKIFKEISELITQDKLHSKLRGEVAHNGFQRLN
jgi:glutamate-1-semialdehyde 2,1-aminomutase